MTGVAIIIVIFIIIIIIIITIITATTIIIIIIFLMNKKKFFAKYIKMVNLTTYELRLIARKRGIKNYRNMSRKKLLSTVDELERNIKTASEKGLERITKMQNLSQNETKSQKCKTNREMN